MNPLSSLVFRVDSNYTYMPYGCRRAGAEEYREFPVRVSVPMAEGVSWPKDHPEVLDADDKPVAASIKPMHLWPDGSVRIWEVWVHASLKREAGYTYRLAFTDKKPRQEKKAKGGALQQPSSFTITAVLGDGTTCAATVTFDATQNSDGAFAVLEDERPFELGKPGEPPAFKGELVRRRWSWYPAVELAVRTINYAPGDESTVKSLTVEFDLPEAKPADPAKRYVIKHAAQTAEMPRLVEAGEFFEVRSDAGGVHVTEIEKLGRKQTDYAVYERGPYAEAVDAWVGTRDATTGWVLTMHEARERAPKGWCIRERHVTIELHPKWAEPLTWRRGMALFQRFYLSQVPTNAPAEEFENEAWRWLRPPIVTVDSEVYRAAGWRIPFRYQPRRFPRTEMTIRDTWTFGWSTGTFDWGDQIQGRLARNHEYDFPASAAKEFARTGHPELWLKARASAEHMMHTDFVAVSDDPWKEGGIPAHCPRHTTGSAYPSHMWAEGLMLYYLLSGDKYALKVGSRLGDFFLKYINERFQVIEATGREAGWALVALAAIYDVTREDRYLKGIKRIVDFYLKGGVKNFFPTDAVFAIGVGLIGLDRVRPFYRDEQLKAFILGVLDELIAHRVDGIGIFDYWFDSERQTFTWLQSHFPEALNIGYKLSGDVKYLKTAWRIFQLHQAGVPLTVQNQHVPSECGYAAGFHLTWTMGCFASFAERGWLDKLQFPDPE